MEQTGVKFQYLEVAPIWRGDILSNGDKIKIATNIPGLKDKIITHISDGKNTVYWYIQFNVPLDESTVSDKTMNITDTSGYIMRTDISYMKGKNIIVISPLDTYEQNVYYILSISTKVRALSGRKMQSQIHILFKLMNNKIADYKVLKSNAEIPAPKKRPHNYDEIRQKLYASDESIFKTAGQDTLVPAKLSINIVAGVIGILIMACFFYFTNIAILAAGFLVCLLGVSHIIYQMSRKKIRSVMVYNKGVRKFNRGQYAEAELYFKRASLLDQNNETAEYALNKVEYYK